MKENPDGDELFVPLAQEQVVVSKEEIITGKVKIMTHVETRQALVQEALRRENVVVERVVIDREVDVAPTIRQEGDVVIYPIVEEILVIEKRLVLKEELRVSYKITTEEVRQSVDLRSVRADVERTPVNVTSTSSNPK